MCIEQRSNMRSKCEQYHVTISQFEKEFSFRQQETTTFAIFLLWNIEEECTGKNVQNDVQDIMSFCDNKRDSQTTWPNRDHKRPCNTRLSVILPWKVNGHLKQITMQSLAWISTASHVMCIVMPSLCETESMEHLWLWLQDKKSLEEYLWTSFEGFVEEDVISQRIMN